jgi:hypothetical protein
MEKLRCDARLSATGCNSRYGGLGAPLEPKNAQHDAHRLVTSLIEKLFSYALYTEKRPKRQKFFFAEVCSALVDAYTFAHLPRATYASF